MKTGVAGQKPWIVYMSTGETLWLRRGKRLEQSVYRNSAAAEKIPRRRCCCNDYTFGLPFFKGSGMADAFVKSPAGGRLPPSRRKPPSRRGGRGESDTVFSGVSPFHFDERIAARQVQTALSHQSR